MRSRPSALRDSPWINAFGCCLRSRSGSAQVQQFGRAIASSYSSGYKCLLLPSAEFGFGRARWIAAATIADGDSSGRWRTPRRVDGALRIRQNSRTRNSRGH